MAEEEVIENPAQTVRHPETAKLETEYTALPDAVQEKAIEQSPTTPNVEEQKS